MYVCLYFFFLAVYRQSIKHYMATLTRQRLHKPEGPASAAVETRAGRKVASGANIAAVPACAPSAHRKI